MGGDFRQVLPVMTHGNRAQIVQATLNRSYLWKHVKVKKLHRNMRVQLLIDQGDIASAQEQQQFANWLQRIGEGTEHLYEIEGNNCIRIPDDLCVGCRERNELDVLIQEVYGDLQNINDWNARVDYIIERAILTPKNEDVDYINNYMAKSYLKETDGITPIKMTPYNSVDSVLEHEQNAIYTVEFLNSFSISGLPPHHLELFVNCPIMLLKNMAGGLANGTRLIITKLMKNVIEAKVTSGPSKGELVCIPRLVLTPSDVKKMPFTLQRRQFPIRPAFAMTINKSQGQTFKMIGVYLREPVFSHGQLYVAFSRVGRRQDLKVMVVNGWKERPTDPNLGNLPAGVYTRNVVFKDVFSPR